MKKFTQIFSENVFVQAPLAQITWYHHIALMDKTHDFERIRLKYEADNSADNISGGR
jgi:hypothetical protein